MKNSVRRGLQTVGLALALSLPGCGAKLTPEGEEFSRKFLYGYAAGQTAQNSDPRIRSMSPAFSAAARGSDSSGQRVEIHNHNYLGGQSGSPDALGDFEDYGVVYSKAPGVGFWGILEDGRRIRLKYDNKNSVDFGDYGVVYDRIPGEGNWVKFEDGKYTRVIDPEDADIIRGEKPGRMEGNFVPGEEYFGTKSDEGFSKSGDFGEWEDDQ